MKKEKMSVLSLVSQLVFIRIIILHNEGTKTSSPTSYIPSETQYLFYCKFNMTGNFSKIIHLITLVNKTNGLYVRYRAYMIFFSSNFNVWKISLWKTFKALIVIMILDISTPHKPIKHFIFYQILNRGSEWE